MLRKFRSLLLLIGLLPCLLAGQSMDSLIQALPSMDANPDKITAYYQLYGHFLYSDPDSAEHYLELGEALSYDLDYPRGIVLAYDKRGGLAMNRSNYELAVL